MSSNQTPATSTSFDNTMRLATGIGIPLMVVALGGMFTWMMKIDDRQYQTQGNMVSPADLIAVEERIIKTVNQRMETMNKTLDGIAENQRRIVDRFYEERERNPK